MYHIFLFFSLFFFNSTLFCSESWASLEDFSGKVELKRKDSSTWITIEAKHLPFALQALDSLRTSTGAFAQLVIMDQGDVFMEENTHAVIPERAQKRKFHVLMEILEGVINCFISKTGSNFAIQTPVSVAGVLGTAFRVEVSPQATSIIVVKSEDGIEIQNLEQNLQTAFILKPIAGDSPIKLTLPGEPVKETSQMMWAMSQEIGKSSAPGNLAMGNHSSTADHSTFSKMEAQGLQENMMGEEKSDRVQVSTAAPMAAKKTTNVYARRGVTTSQMMKEEAFPRYGLTTDPSLEIWKDKELKFPAKNKHGITGRLPYSKFENWRNWFRKRKAKKLGLPEERPK